MAYLRLCFRHAALRVLSFVYDKKKERSLAMRLYYQPKGYWFGDCMPFGKGDTFYLFHQRDTRKPCPFGEPFGWDLATTKDFVTYEDCGTAILRGDDTKQCL